MKFATNTGQKWRVDAEHREPPDPHMYDLPEIHHIEAILERLNSPEADLRTIASKLSRFSGLSRYLVAWGNYLLTSENNRFVDPVHATVYLGTRRLNELLIPLANPEPPAKAG